MIDTIMTGIEALAPTYDSDVTVNVWGYDAIKDTLNESECPVRMVLAPDDKVRSQMDVISLGATQKMTWEILDRLYMFPVALDQGIENYNHRFYFYKESYAAAVKANRCLSTTNASVQAVYFDGPYMRPYPDVEGSPMFWVIDALLVVEEFI